jgi:hypothetical protein
MISMSCSYRDANSGAKISAKKRNKFAENRHKNAEIRTDLSRIQPAPEALFAPASGRSARAG